MNESIVVYRSRTEQAIGEAYWDAVQNTDPSMGLAVFGILVAAAFVVFVFCQRR